MKHELLTNSIVIIRAEWLQNGLKNHIANDFTDIEIVI